MNLKKYPDGTSYINSTKLGQQVFRINTYEDLWHLNQFVDAFHSEYSTLTKKIRPNIIIPNLIDAQADRRFNKGESSGLKLVCKFLNGMNANFKIFHPHNPEVVEALMDNVMIIDNSEFVDQVTYKIIGEPQYRGDIDKIHNNLVLMSSDAGGFKPLMKLCDKIGWKGETWSATKARHPITNELTQIINKKDFKGKDILIVDDICVYGGTFKGLSNLLKERNCGKLYLAVSHMTVQNLGEDPVTNYFDKVFTTDSKFDRYYSYVEGWEEDKYPENLKIINLF